MVVLVLVLVRVRRSSSYCGVCGLGRGAMVSAMVL